MPLAPGTRLGPYEIGVPIGAGGMGEVYRARDTRLDRTVAVKVLPGHLSSDPERRQRLEREARAVSSLHHPHICVLHDIGHQDGIDYLVMECLEGEPLGDRLDKGPLPLDQALRHGIEIADALDKAHRQGVVHRDLKPANVMLTKAGAKLLDFGLAKHTRVLGATGEASVLATRTQDKPLTGEGTLVGTLHYMAPEQLEGREADARTDIWALGLVLYEMTTGKKAFSGKSQASLIGAILKEEPLPLAQLQPMTPPSLGRLVKTCLAKDPDERWQSAHDVVAELRWIAESPAADVRAQDQRRGRRGYPGWIVAGLLAAALTAVLSSRRQPGEIPVVRASISVPGGTAVDSISLSPDGRHLAFAGSASDGRTLLWLRPLDSDAARPLPGTEGAAFPFWSPDSRFLGFFAEGSLKKVDAAGGPVEALCSVPLARGGTWNREGVIVFSQTQHGLYRISTTGGQATPVTTLDPSRRESSHRWPHFLPDGRHVLYYAVSPQPENSAIYVTSLDSRETRRLTAATSNAAYSRPGYLLFERGGALMAQPFDVRTQRLGGDPLAVAEKVVYDAAVFRALFTVSQSGVLAYQTAASYNTQVAWFDRGGKSLGVLPSAGNSYNLSLSPDDKGLAVSRSASAREGRDIWLYDLLHGTNSRLTFDPGADIVPIWSPDGSRIVFGSNREGPYDLYLKPSSGSAGDEPLLKTSQTKYATDWSPDGRFIVYDTLDPKSSSDLWVLPMTGERKPVPFLQTEAEEMQARFSPDGRWLAYTSNESGRSEVYVQTFPASGGKWQVSSRGGIVPRWRRDGKELLYVGLDQKVMAVSVRLGATFEHDPPRELFEARGVDLFTYRSPYAVTGDGQRFFFSTRTPGATSAPIQLVLNWTAGLKR